MQRQPFEIVTTPSPKQNTKVHRSVEQWQELMQTYKDSDLTQQAFCQQHNIPQSTFYSWRSKLKKLTTKVIEPQTTQESFIALTPPQTIAKTDNDWDAELSLANGVTIRLRT